MLGRGVTLLIGDVLTAVALEVKSRWVELRHLAKAAQKAIQVAVMVAAACAMGQFPKLLT